MLTLAEYSVSPQMVSKIENDSFIEFFNLPTGPARSLVRTL